MTTPYADTIPHIVQIEEARTLLHVNVIMWEPKEQLRASAFSYPTNTSFGYSKVIPRKTYIGHSFLRGQQGRHLYPCGVCGFCGSPYAIKGELDNEFSALFFDLMFHRGKDGNGRLFEERFYELYEKSSKNNVKVGRCKRCSEYDSFKSYLVDASNSRLIFDSMTEEKLEHSAMLFDMAGMSRAADRARLELKRRGVQVEADCPKPKIPDKKAPTNVASLDGLSGVYGIRSGPYIKVGASVNVLKRFSSIKTANPNCHVVGVVVCDDWFATEGKMHEEMSDSHYRAEWFEASDAEFERAAKSIGKQVTKLTK